MMSGRGDWGELVPFYSQEMRCTGMGSESRFCKSRQMPLYHVYFVLDFSQQLN